MLDELLEKNEYVKEKCKEYCLMMDGPDSRHRVLVKDMIRGRRSGPDPGEDPTAPGGRPFLLEVS